MGFDTDQDRDRKRSADQPSETNFRDKPKPKKKPPAGEVGQALRSAYQRTIDEDIPPEFLDLLGKLG